MILAPPPKFGQTRPINAHDPLVCGVTGADSLCPRCARAPDRELLERNADAKRHERIRHTIRQLLEIGIDIDALAVALLPALAVGIAEIVGAVMEEREGSA